MMITPHHVSQALVPVDGQEEIVRRGFWRKVRRLVASVPFLDRVIAVYYSAQDPATPAAAKAVLFAALAYFVVPADIIPDILGTIGFSDDLAVLMAVWTGLGPHITDAHRDRAREMLDDLAAR